MSAAAIIAERRVRLEARLLAVRSEAAVTDPPCPGCGCTRARRCFYGNDDGEAWSCMRLAGLDVCTECVNRRARAER